MTDTATQPEPAPTDEQTIQVPMESVIRQLQNRHSRSMQQADMEIAQMGALIEQQATELAQWRSGQRPTIAAAANGVPPTRRTGGNGRARR